MFALFALSAKTVVNERKADGYRIYLLKSQIRCEKQNLIATRVAKIA